MNRPYIKHCGNVFRCSGSGMMKFVSHCMQRFFLFLLLIVSTSGVFLSCTKEQYCSNPVVAYLNSGFYCWKDGALTDTAIKLLTVYGISSDSMLYDSASNRKSVDLPLSNNADTSRFVFILTVEIPPEPPDTIPVTTTYTDTMSVMYSHRMYLITALCGFGYDYRLQDAFVTNNLIDSVIITNRDVIITNENTEEHIQILF